MIYINDIYNSTLTCYEENNNLIVEIAEPMQHIEDAIKFYFHFDKAGLEQAIAVQTVLQEWINKVHESLNENK